MGLFFKSKERTSSSDILCSRNKIDKKSNKRPPAMAAHVLMTVMWLMLMVQYTDACCGYYGCYCVYSLWYFWFGLFWILVFLIMLIVGCIKKHKHSRAQVSSVAVITSGQVNHSHQPPPLQKPMSPPSYAQASHDPPPYPGPPPSNPGAPPYNTSMYPPPAQSYYPPTANGAMYPQGSSYPPPPPPNDPAYPPVR